MSVHRADTVRTLAYVTAAARRRHLARREKVTEEESLRLDAASKVVFWSSQCDYALEREVYDLVDAHAGRPPPPARVDWAVLDRYAAKMRELAARPVPWGAGYRERGYLGSIRYVRRAMRRLERAVVGVP